MPADSDSPNVLLITTDHWPASLLGCAGNLAIQTPTLDTIARNGIWFTHCYSECPVCIPARRTLMTGTSPCIHGDRTFQTELPMPDMPTMAETFRRNGYQATAVGKLHVFPQRNRIGFDDVILAEEGRPDWGVIDDYETYLGQQGFAGRQFEHGMSNNEYVARTWHLPEEHHVTNWTTREMTRTIRRRDPTRPGFWYLSYTHPHPPLVPLPFYWDMYKDTEFPDRMIGEWANDFDGLPHPLKIYRDIWSCSTDDEIRFALRAVYALCTHIDHQLRLVLGTLREEGILDNTIVAFTSDHGDMLGNHRLWAKRLFYEQSANVPLLLMGCKDDPRVPVRSVDSQLVGWQDIMPTLLDLAHLEIPETVTGQSVVSAPPRNFLYGECNEDDTATRMIHNGQYKLIYYASGNRTQLFDVNADPDELHDLAEVARFSEVRSRLTELLIAELYGSDKQWLKDGQLIGQPEPEFTSNPRRDLNLQRGTHWPPPPRR